MGAGDNTNARRVSPLFELDCPEISTKRELGAKKPSERETDRALDAIKAGVMEMALKEIGEDGSTYNVITMSHQSDFDLVWLKMTLAERNAIEREINRRLDEMIKSPDPNWGSITNTSIEGGKPQLPDRSPWRLVWYRIRTDIHRMRP